MFSRKRIIRLLLFMLILFPASCGRIPGSMNQNAAQNAAQDREYLVPVTRGDIAATTSFVGNLQYSQSSSLTWKTAGVIGSVNVKVGDHVKKGDILAVLETESLSSSVILSEKTMIEQQEKLEDVESSESARMQAYVNLNAKESALNKAKLSQEALYYPRATRQDMELAWDTLALANLNFNYAKQDYDALVANNETWEGYEPPVTVYRVRYTGEMGSRQMMQMMMSGRNIRDLQNDPDFAENIVVEAITYGGDDRSGRQRKFEEYVSTYNDLVEAYENYLWTTGQPSATDYAVAEGNVQVAQIEYDKALEEYLSYGTLPRKKDVNAAQVALNNAEASFNQRFIIAPFDGTVTSVSAVEGYYVTRESAAVRLDDMTRIFIPISIPELDVSSVVNGTAVSITVDAIPGKTFSGHIYTISDAGDTSGSAASFGAAVEVDDPDEHMLAGMTAEISMQLDPKTDVLLIPTAAITYTDGEPTVIIAEDGIRKTVSVKLGVVRDNIAEVTSGNLTEGTQLIVSRIDQTVLLRLGLDPAEILGQPASVPAQIPEVPDSDAIYVKPSFVPPEAPAGIPTGVPTGIPAEIPSPGTGGDPREFSPDMIPGQMPKEPPSDAALAKPSAVPSETPAVTSTPVPSAVPTETPVSKENSKPQEITPTAAPAAEGTASDIPVPETMPEGIQMPPMGEGGQFPGMPGGQRPDMSGNGQFRPPSGGQMPDMDSSGTFQRPSGGQRPRENSSGQFPGAGQSQQNPQETAEPASRPTATPVPEDIIPDKG